MLRIVLFASRILNPEQPVVQPHLGRNGMPGRDPVNHPLNLAPVSRRRIPGSGIVGAVKFDDLPGLFVLHHAFISDDVGIPEADLPSRTQAVIFFRRVFEKVVLFDVKLPGEGQLPCSHVGILGMVGAFDLLNQVLRIIVDHHPKGVQDAQRPGGMGIEVLPDAVLQQGDVDQVVIFRHADLGAEVPDGFRGVAPAAHARDGRHPGVIPALDEMVFHQFNEPPFAEHRVAQVEAGEFDLLRTRARYQFLHEPVVKGTVVFKLQGADGVGDPFQGVGEAVGEVVHGVDHPVGARPVVGLPLDAVDDGVAHDDVRRGHVDLRAQNMGAVGKLAGPHPGKEIEVLFHRPVAIGAFSSRLGEASPVLPDFIGSEAADIGVSGSDELDGERIKPFEVIGGVKEPVCPVESKPADIVDNRFHEFHGLSQGVRVIHPEIAGSLVLLGDAEIEANRLGMTDVDVAVWFGREAGGHSSLMFVGPQVIVDDVPDEIRRV